MVTDGDRENDESNLPPLSVPPSLPPPPEVSESRILTTVPNMEDNDDDNGCNENRATTCRNNEMISAKALTQITPKPGMNGINSTTYSFDDGDDEYGELDEFCEVVLSFKCRHCSFLCQDKGELTFHLRNSHSGHNGDKIVKNTIMKIHADEEQDIVRKGTLERYRKKSDGFDGDSLLCKNGVQKVEQPPTPSVPATPDALLVEDSTSPTPDDDLGVMDEGTDHLFGMDDQVEDVFLCAECDIVFASKELCCSHMHEVHDLTQFNPDFIQDEIISKKPTEVPLPKRRRAQPPKHLTEEGGAVVPKRFRVTKEVFYACSKCSTRFESKEVMKFHEQCHAQEEQSEDSSKKSGRGAFVCPVCEDKTLESPEVFAKWGPCAGHLWREHKIDCELYTCSVCKNFKSNLITRVKEHERVHMRQAVYLCQTCKKTFKQLKQLRCHEKFHKEKMTKLSPPTDSRWYTPKECHICKRILSDAKCLKKHISAVHKKLKPYCCNICGHMTARKAELQLHMRIHTQEKPYKCPFCSFNTGDHNSLRKHKLRHSDKRPYMCPYCDYRCIQSCAFKKHILAVHPGQEVVFVCQLCSHASVNEILFAVHQKDHAEGRLPSEIQSENNTSVVQENGSIQNHNPSGPSSSKLTSKKSSQPTWMEEDSLDVVDTGGVTIPASPVGNHSREISSSDLENASEKHAELDANGGERSPVPAAPVLTQEKGVETRSEVAGSNVSIPSNGSLLPLQPGQTTYILLPPNTPLPFHPAFPLLGSSTTLANHTLVGNHNQNNVHVDSQNVSISMKAGTSEKSFNGIIQSNQGNHAGSLLISTISKDDGKSSSSQTNDKDSTNPFNCPHSSNQILETIPHLNNLDLVEVINACNQPSSSNDSMFEKLLGMSGI